MVVLTLYFVGWLIAEGLVSETIGVIMYLLAHKMDHKKHASTASGHCKHNLVLCMVKAIEAGCQILQKYKFPMSCLPESGDKAHNSNPLKGEDSLSHFRQ
jgi:hypothetical protein